MTTPRRSARPPNVYRPPARRPSRQVTAPSDVDTMKVGGVLLCLSAVVSVVAAVLARDPGQPAASQTGAFGTSFFVLLLGLGLYQGVGAVRIFVLVLMGLGAFGAIFAAAFLHSIPELRFLALVVLLTAVGYFALLLKKEASRARVVISVALIVLGAAGSLSAQFWFVGLAKRAFGEELRKLASDRREYADPDAGISVVVPEGWVILRDDAGVYGEVPSKVKLANPDAGTVAFINYDQRRPGLLTLDHYLDAILQGLKEAGIEAEQTARTDVTVGKASARRMTLNWTEEGRPVSGFFSIWLDGDRIFMYIGAVPGTWTRDAEEDFAVLERALQFTAPVETALTDAENRLTTRCPIFTATSVRTIARRISPGSPTETYFKTGWTWALKGQGALDAGQVSQLGPLMGQVFSAMSPADRQSFGAYSEKLRAERPTSPREDATAMAILGRAASALPPDSLAQLQGLTDAALTVGMLL